MEDCCICAIKAVTKANRDYNYDRDNILYIRRLPHGTVSSRCVHRTSTCVRQVPHNRPCQFPRVFRVGWSQAWSAASVHVFWKVCLSVQNSAHSPLRAFCNTGSRNLLGRGLGHLFLEHHPGTLLAAGWHCRHMVFCGWTQRGFVVKRRARELYLGLSNGLRVSLHLLCAPS